MHWISKELSFKHKTTKPSRDLFTNFQRFLLQFASDAHSLFTYKEGNMYLLSIIYAIHQSHPLHFPNLSFELHKYQKKIIEKGRAFVILQT